MDIDISNDALQAAAERANQEQRSVIDVINTLMRDYAEGRTWLNLPEGEQSAAAPASEKAWRRKMARSILALNEEDSNAARRGAPNVGPYGDMSSSLRRLARGEELPSAKELRGGFWADDEPAATEGE